MIKKSKRRTKQYAMYRGEEFIDIGTAEELAERHNTSVKHIYWCCYATRWKQVPHTRGGYEVYKVEEDDND